MAKKTPEEIKQMVELYEELGTYSAVAKKLKVSPGTVSKYVKENKNLLLAKGPVQDPFNKEIPSIEEIEFPTDWKNLLNLSNEEREDLKNLQKEIYIHYW